MWGFCLKCCDNQNKGCTFVETNKEKDMKAQHQLAAKTLRYAGYKAKCIFNGLMEQPYEVHVKGISDNECKELQLILCSMIKDDRINIINI
jgi:hypothetical protein